MSEFVASIVLANKLIGVFNEFAFEIPVVSVCCARISFCMACSIRVGCKVHVHGKDRKSLGIKSGFVFMSLQSTFTCTVF